MKNVAITIILEWHSILLCCKFSEFMEKAVSDFLHVLKVPVSGAYIKKLLRSHPDYPSLLSISDVLQRLGVYHVAHRVNREELNDVPYPFLLPLDKGRGDTLLIRNEMDLKKYEPYMDQWGGVVLQAKPTDKTKDKTNNELRSWELNIRKSLIVLIVCNGIFLSFSLFSSFSFLVLFLMIIAIAGGMIGYFLMAKELGITYKVIDDFCNTGKNTNCDKVLKSDVGLMGIRFSDAVVVYFLFQIITLAFAQANPVLLQILKWLSICTWPVILFSLYYQYFVAKTWCRLCLVVVGILILQSVGFMYSLYAGDILSVSFSTSLPSIIKSGLLFIVIGAFILMIKNALQRSNKLILEGTEGNMVKHSGSVFTELLLQQKKLNIVPFDKEVILGNPGAPVKITMVSNLYCNPCKERHEVVDELAAMYPDKVCVALRFVESGKDVAENIHSLHSIVGYWLENIYNKPGESASMAGLLHDWFAIWDLEKFTKKYPNPPTNKEEVNKIVERQYKWVEEVAVTSTPTFFVNGYQLPKEYSINDMLAMVPSLSDDKVFIQAVSELEKV